MIIVSQDKKQIINFERTSNIWVSEEIDGDFEVFEINADGELLGIYKTEKRAKEILIAIMASYQANKILECIHGNIEQNQIAEKFLESGTLPFRYEMPEE